jgi:peptidoglycan/LPS O-acetylase OafA/YrhL
VDVFFVISGFLITSLLLQEHRQNGRISLKKFYARRTLRLFPLLYAALAIVGVAGIIAKFTGLLESTVYPLKDLVLESAASAVYMHNIFYPTLGGAWHAHLWTLSVEEQFYLVVGITMVVALTRGGIRGITAMLVIGIVAIQLSRGFGITGPFKIPAIAVWLQRPDSLMIGMLGAIINAHIPDPMSDRARRLMKLGGWIGIVGIFVSVWASSAFFRNQLGWHVPFWPGDANYTTNPDGVIQKLADAPGNRIDMTGGVYWLQWGFTVANWSFLLVTFPAFRVKEWLPNKPLSWGPLVKIGALFSYGLYIWHYPVQHFLRMAIGTTSEACTTVGTAMCRAGDHYRMNLNPIVQLILDCGLPFLLAVPTYYLVERKALALKDRFQVDKASLAHAQEVKAAREGRAPVPEPEA